MRVICPFNEQYSLVLRAAWNHQLTFPFKDVSSGSWNRHHQENTRITNEVVPYHGNMNGLPYWQCYECHKPILDETGKPVWDAREIEEFEEDYINEEQKTGPVLTQQTITDLEKEFQTMMIAVPTAINNYFTAATKRTDTVYLRLDYDLTDRVAKACNTLTEKINKVLQTFYAALFIKNISLDVPRFPYSFARDSWKRIEDKAFALSGQQGASTVSGIQTKYINQYPSLLIEFKKLAIEELKPFFDNCQKAILTLKPLVGLEAVHVTKNKVLMPLCNICAEEARFYCQAEDCDFHTTDEDEIIDVESKVWRKPDAQHDHQWLQSVTSTYCDEHAAKCGSCGDGVLKDGDETTEYEGEFYHVDCFNEIYSLCEECGEYFHSEDMMWDEERETEVCPNCYEEEREGGVEADIEEDDLENAAKVIDRLPKLFPLEEKIIAGSILPALKAGAKKLQSNPTMPFDQQLAFVLKRIQTKDAQNAVIAKSRTMDSLQSLYEFFSEHQKDLATFKEKYPKLKGFKPLPVDVKVEGGKGHEGKVFAVYPSEEFLDYAELMQPGARAIYGEYIKHRGHHPGALAFARFSMSDGNIIIDNLQTDIDSQTFKSTFNSLKEQEQNALRWWLTAIKKFWVPALLDALHKFGKEIEKKIYLTTFQMQKTKWQTLPERNKDVYERIPDAMQFPIEQVEAKPEDLTRKTYNMRRVANSLDKAAYAYYKLVQLL